MVNVAMLSVDMVSVVMLSVVLVSVDVAIVVAPTYDRKLVFHLVISPSSVAIRQFSYESGKTTELVVWNTMSRLNTGVLYLFPKYLFRQSRKITPGMDKL